MKHGTPAGYNRHLAADEAPCTACNDAKNDYRKLVRARTASRMQMPVNLIAGLYLAAPIKLQEMVEEYLTAPAIDALVARLDSTDKGKDKAA